MLIERVPAMQSDSQTPGTDIADSKVPCCSLLWRYGQQNHSERNNLAKVMLHNDHQTLGNLKKNSILSLGPQTHSVATAGNLVRDRVSRAWNVLELCHGRPDLDRIPCRSRICTLQDHIRRPHWGVRRLFAKITWWPDRYLAEELECRVLV